LFIWSLKFQYLHLIISRILGIELASSYESIEASAAKTAAMITKKKAELYIYIYYIYILEYYTSALTMRKAKHGDDHPDVTDTLKNMAIVYMNQGDYDKALECFTSALTIFKAKHGDDHPATKSIVRSIGLCREAMS
jgi:tetratricopeptide (TPR) repeat protein